MQRSFAIAVAVVAAMLLARLRHSRSRRRSERSQIADALRGSPPRQASLHAQADRLISVGPKAFKALLVSLRGYPIVINEWGSWCSNCVLEFPAFQRAAVKYGARVAFIGVDVEDANGSATAFLRRFPVSYPSYVDHSQDIARAIEASGYYPQTVYLDRHGRLVIDHGGSYATTAALEHDIQRYALQ